MAKILVTLFYIFDIVFACQKITVSPCQQLNVFASAKINMGSIISEFHPGCRYEGLVKEKCIEKQII
jgi:hypothetical protein